MIFVGTHHKTGTVLMSSVFCDLSRALGLKYFAGWQDRLPPAADVWFMPHSRISSDLFAAIRGVHIIRHPLNVIFSGYRYHQICQEPWCVQPGAKTIADGISYDFEGLSYQEKLKSLNEHHGLLFEMMGRSYNTIIDMYRWDYTNPAILTVKIEDMTAAFEETFAQIFAFLRLPSDIGLEIARRYDLARMGREEIMAADHITDKNRRGDHRRCFSPALLEVFGGTFPSDLLDRLGYGAVR